MYGTYETIDGKPAVRFERLLPGPIERVWEFVTESEPRSRWLAAGPRPRPRGGRGECASRPRR